jgi:CSLREA domain-containing protein
MSWNSWCRLLNRDRQSRSPEQRKRRRSFRPRLDMLEDRLAPATITVTTAADDLTPNDGSVSLREAIAAVNAGNDLGDPDITAQNPGTFGINDRINFNIDGGGVHTIRPATQLPTVGKPVTIDGYTQPGASPNTLAVGDNAVLLIELDGETSGGSGLDIIAGNCTVQGLVINRFAGDGISFRDGGVTGDLVQGNFIGTNAAGTASLGNNIGIGFVQNFGPPSGNTIGGTTPAARNLISGNGVASGGGSGILMANTVLNTLIEGNYIGTNAAGTAALPNEFGIGFSAGSGNPQNNTIGGTALGAGNVISGNLSNGIVVGIGSGNIIQGNLIGTQGDGTSRLGNGGAGVNIDPFGGNSNTVGGTVGAGNVIAFNGGAGVSIASGVGQAVLSNSIHDNAGLGIDLGGSGTPVLNNAQGHNGPNNFQNYSVLTGLATAATTTTVSGTLNSTPNATFTVQFFANAAPNPSGFGEGQNFLGSAPVTTDATGNVSFTITLPTALPANQPFITMTATDAGNNTSEFSALGTVSTLMSSANASTVGQTITLTATVASDDLGSPTPTGTVTFQDGATALGTVALDAAGQATLQVSTLSGGSHPLVAAYSGDPIHFRSNSAPLTQQVNKIDSAVTLASSVNPTRFGQPVTFTATVIPAAPVTPTGSVDFVDTSTGTDLGSQLLGGGGASLTTSALGVGSHTITANYDGDASYNASNNSTSQTVNQAATTTTVVTSDHPSGSPFGQAITFTATVSAASGTPTGTVSFTVDGTAQPPVGLTNGQATFTTSTLTAGSHAVSAAYNGDPNFSSSTGSLSPSQTVTSAAGSGVINAVVFFDYNADGRQEANDPAVAGQTLFLDLNHTGRLDPGDPRSVTAADGSSQFPNLAAGSYTVRQLLPFDNVAVTGTAASTVTAVGGGLAATSFGVVIYNPAYPVYPRADLWAPHPNTDANTAFVRGLYATVLGRTAEATGLASWLGRLAAGSTREQVAVGFINSVEHRQAEVDAFYAALLGRAPDPASDSWVKLLLRDGNEAEVVEGIVTSPEFTASHASNAAFVADLYTRLLGRPADGGSAGWQQQLDGGGSRLAVVRGFLDSTESAQLAVNSFYAAFLHRPGDTTGMAGWVNQLSTESLTFSQVALGFLAAHEFDLDASQNVP